MSELVEIEWKYRIPDPESAQRLLAAQQLGPCTVGEFTLRSITDAYYDTADAALRGAGYALRFRQGKTNGSVQLKTLVEAGAGVHRRTEIHIATDQPDRPETWPDGPGRDLVLGALQGRQIDRLFTIAQNRHIAPLWDGDDQVAEISIDEVHWVAGPKTVTDWEMEVELASGQEESRLAGLNEALVGEWRLIPERQSKYERGIHLLSASTARGVADHAAVPKSMRFQLEEPATALLQRIIAAQSVKLHEQYEGVLKGEDPEAVHDARVAARRMRSALYFFEPWLSAKYDTELRQQLRTLGRMLGPVRDLDVSLIYIHEHAGQVAPAAEAPLSRHLGSQRETARRAMLDYYKGKSYKRLRTTLSEFSSARLRTKERLGGILPGLMQRAIAEVHLYDDTLTPGCPVEHLHALRIAVKQLRYLLEFTRHATSPVSDPITALVTAMQEHLGDMHDADFSCLLAFSLLRDPEQNFSAEERQGLLTYGLALASQRDEMIASFIDRQSLTSLWSTWLEAKTQALLTEMTALLGK